jgi:flagellin-like protein
MGGPRRRGVSEIVAVLLMIAIVAALGTTAFWFASSSLGTLGGGFSNLMGSQASAVVERFAVEQVVFTESGSPQGATLYVRNVGPDPVRLVEVYVADASTGAFVGGFPVSVSILVGGFAIIPPSSVGFTPVAGETYSFKVVSSYGNGVIVYATA